MKYGGLNEEKNGDPNKRLFTKAVAYLSDPIKKAAKSAGCLVAGASMLTGSGVFGQTFANPALFYGGANASLDLVMGMETAFGGISGMEGIYGGMLMEETILHLDRPEAMLIGLVLE